MSRIRQSARGRPCTVRLIGVCDGGGATTVWAHSNELAHGKGMGLKADDRHGAFACWGCHEVVDGRKPRPHCYDRADITREFRRAMRESVAILISEGVLDGSSSAGDSGGDGEGGGP